MNCRYIIQGIIKDTERRKQIMDDNICIIMVKPKSRRVQLRRLLGYLWGETDDAK